MPDIYEQRKEQQQLREQYRAHVQAMIKEDQAYGPRRDYKFRLDDHANVQIMDDGAFVELIVWVPKVQLDKN